MPSIKAFGLAGTGTYIPLIDIGITRPFQDRMSDELASIVREHGGRFPENAHNYIYLPSTGDAAFGHQAHFLAPEISAHRLPSDRQVAETDLRQILGKDRITGISTGRPAGCGGRGGQRPH